MIPIKYSLETASWYYHRIIDCISDAKKPQLKKSKTDHFINEIETIIKKYNFNCFKDLVIADFNTITEKISNYDFTNDNNQLKKLISLYDKSVKAKANLEIIEKSKIRVCPYCNANYINNRRTGTSAQLDHFYNKDDFPIFSVSLFNLIPSCYACNHLKGKVNIAVSPSDQDFDFEKAITFSYVPISIEFMNSADKLNIEIQTVNDIRNCAGKRINIQDNMIKMQIGNEYELHRDYAWELIQKSLIYSELRIFELIKSFQQANFNREELLRMVYSNYIAEQDLSNRPLSKLSKDLLTELGIEIKQ